MSAGNISNDSDCVLAHSEQDVVVVLADEPGQRPRDNIELEQVMILQRRYSASQSRLEYPERRAVFRSIEVLDDQPNGRFSRAEAEQGTYLNWTSHGELRIAKILPEPIAAAVPKTARGENLENAIEQPLRAPTRQLVKGCFIQAAFTRRGQNAVRRGVGTVCHTVTRHKVPAFNCERQREDPRSCLSDRSAVVEAQNLVLNVPGRSTAGASASLQMSDNLVSHNAP